VARKASERSYSSRTALRLPSAAVGTARHRSMVTI
jgi:hypothetical protein